MPSSLVATIAASCLLTRVDWEERERGVGRGGKEGGGGGIRWERGVGFSEKREKVRGKWIDGDVGWNSVYEEVVAGWVEDGERGGK